MGLDRMFRIGRNGQYTVGLVII